MPKSPDSEGVPRLMTVTEIALEHGVSRQTVHSYRTRGTFPKPVEGEGSTRPRFRADEVAAWFAANPPRPGKRTDLARDEGTKMWSTDAPETGPRISAADQDQLQAEIEQCVMRAAQALGLPDPACRMLASASLEGVRGLIEEWRKQ
ncbi:helix-turn-helix transcriptional regulator [Streptomyces griseosporeus]|uniref:helix-turn-helix transcriptional regulator n=1 Tax=Streptomyces griseosporeus TaxID=1910 RepID=UPI0036FE8414